MPRAALRDPAAFVRPLSISGQLSGVTTQTATFGRGTATAAGTSWTAGIWPWADYRRLMELLSPEARP